MMRILHQLHFRDEDQFSEEDLPSYGFPAMAKNDFAGYGSGDSGVLRGLLGQHPNPPVWYPKTKWHGTNYMLYRMIKKIGLHRWLSDDEIDAALAVIRYHRWDLGSKIVFEPFPGGITRSFSDSSSTASVPAWYREAFHERKIAFLWITGPVPRAASDPQKMVDDHWAGGLVYMPARTIYYVDGMAVGREDRARIFLSRVTNWWSRFGDQESGRRPVRIEFVPVQAQNDTWSCGPLLLEWVTRLLYNPAALFQPRPKVVLNRTRLWVQRYARCIGVQPRHILLTFFDGQARDHGDLSMASGPAVNIAGPRWKADYKRVVERVAGITRKESFPGDWEQRLKELDKFNMKRNPNDNSGARPSRAQEHSRARDQVPVAPPSTTAPQPRRSSSRPPFAGEHRRSLSVAPVQNTPSQGVSPGQRSDSAGPRTATRSASRPPVAGQNRGSVGAAPSQNTRSRAAVAGQRRASMSAHPDQQKGLSSPGLDQGSSSVSRSASEASSFAYAQPPAREKMEDYISRHIGTLYDSSKRRHPAFDMRAQTAWKTPYVWKNDADREVEKRPLPYHAQGWRGWDSLYMAASALGDEYRGKVAKSSDRYKELQVLKTAASAGQNMPMGEDEVFEW